MARSSSASNASQNVARGGSRGSGGALTAAGAGAIAGGVRRAGSSSKGSSGLGSLTRYLTDESQGFKIGPTAVLISSLVFIFVVVTLHILGKLRR